MINFKNPISLDYLFNVNPTIASRSDKLFLMLGALAVVLAVAFKISAILALNPVDKKYRGKIFNFLVTVGIWEIVWFGFRYEHIYFFGSNFLAALGLLIGFFWLAIIVFKMVKYYGLERRNWEKEQVRLKYLPK